MSQRRQAAVAAELTPVLAELFGARPDYVAFDPSLEPTNARCMLEQVVEPAILERMWSRQQSSSVPNCGELP